MPEEQATYHTTNTDMPDTGEAPRSPKRTLQIIQDIAEQAVEDGEDLEGALIQIHHEAGHPSSDFQALAERTLEWADDKGIRSEGTAKGQADKHLEEAIETWVAVHRFQPSIAKDIAARIPTWESEVEGFYGRIRVDDAQVRDAFGDVMVTQINTARAYLDETDREEVDAAEWLLDCLEEVLGVLEGRTGKMIDGKLVKDEDL